MLCESSEAFHSKMKANDPESVKMNPFKSGSIETWMASR